MERDVQEAHCGRSEPVERNGGADSTALRSRCPSSLELDEEVRFWHRADPAVVAGPSCGVWQALVVMAKAMRYSLGRD